MNNNFSLPNIITSITALSVGFYIGVRAIYWGFADIPKDESSFYNTLDALMPLQYFGYALLVVAICFVIASLAFGYRNENKISSYFMAVGGGLSFIIHFLMATASYNNSINWLTTWQLAILAIFTGAIGVYSVVDIYARRK